MLHLIGEFVVEIPEDMGYTGGYIQIEIQREIDFKDINIESHPDEHPNLISFS